MKHTGIREKTLSFILTFCMVLGLLPALSLTASADTKPADDTGYPVYCITSNSIDGYDVHKQTESGKAFSVVSTGVELDDALSVITTEVGSGAATLAFGNAFDETAGTISGTLNIDNGEIHLGSEGTYTVTGNLSGSGSSHTLILLSGASLTVAGASLNSEGITISNESGSVTVNSGSVVSSKLFALLLGGGSTTISGGTVSSGSRVFAVYDMGSDSVMVSGGTISCAGGFGISSMGTVKVTGGNISGESAVSAMTAKISGGTLTGDESPALVCAGSGSTITGGTLTSADPTTTFVLTDGYFPGTVLVTDIGNTVGNNAGLTISGGTITNTSDSGYAVCCCDYVAEKNDSGTTAELYLSGTPNISGPVCVGANTAVYAFNGAGASYTGDTLTLYYGGSITTGTTIAVSNVTYGTNDDLFTLSNDGYGLLRKNTNLIIVAAPAAPTGLSGVAPTTNIGIDGSISGTTSDMEYKRTSTSDNYTACTDGSTTAVGAAGDYLVRYAATDTSAAGTAATVTVPAYGTYSVTGTVEDSSGNFVSGATVKITQGKKQIGFSATTETNGKFTIINVPDGEYNLIVMKESRTVTEFITVSGQDYATGVIILPVNKKNSVLDVTGDDTPDVVVNGLDQEAEAQSEDSCTVAMTVEKKEADDAKIQKDASAIAILAGSQTIEYLKIDVTKTIGADTTALTNLSTVQEITIPYDFSGKTKVTVYRYHDGSASALMALTSRPASFSSATDGTFYADSANGKIYVYTSQFSTYAIGYSTSSASGNSTSGSSSSGTVSYTITATTGTGGTINPSGSVSVTKGSSKTFAITANEGYEISDVLVDGKSVGVVSKYTFSNIMATHTIKSAFSKTASGSDKASDSLPYYYDDSNKKVFIGFAAKDSGTMNYIAPNGASVLFAENQKNFTDISGHWAKLYINFVTEREIFIGTGNNIFSPDTGMTRAMFATVIGRLYERSYGTLSVSGVHAFTDCDYENWYGSYIGWCSENGIIEGIGGGQFAPNREITRQEMATILYRLAEFLKVSEVTDGTVLIYSDSADIDSWAQNAALYCQKTGIIAGRDEGSFAPKETATRAEVATILERYVDMAI